MSIYFTYVSWYIWTPVLNEPSWYGGMWVSFLNQTKSWKWNCITCLCKGSISWKERECNCANDVLLLVDLNWQATSLQILSLIIDASLELALCLRDQLSVYTSVFIFFIYWLLFFHEHPVPSIILNSYSQLPNSTIAVINLSRS